MTLDLSTFGLTTNQSTLYQSGLQLGSTTVTKLSRATGLSRVLTYNTLQELTKKGYVSCVMKGNTGWYTMATPDVLSQQLHNHATQFDTLLPQLKMLTNQLTGGFQVQHFQGRQGVKNLYLQVAQSTTDFKAYLGADHIDPEINTFLYEEYLPLRISHGIYSKSICPYTPNNEIFGDQQNIPQTEVRYITDPVYNMDCEIILYDHDKISIASMAPEEMSGILITSKRLHDSFTKLFERMRKSLG